MKNKTIKTSNWLIEGLSEEELEVEKKLAVISAKIQLRRIEMNMDQKQFAKFMGVSQGMVSRWESGSYNFTIATLVNICNKLSLSFEPKITASEVEELSQCYAKTAQFIPGSRHAVFKGYSNWISTAKTVEMGGVA